MSSVFSKSREKRGRSSSGESNNSFVKNVTSRVSGLLPATLTKWFSSPSRSANGSAPVAEISDSSSDDEVVETTPPSKRRRTGSPRSCIVHENLVTTANASTETENQEAVPTSVLYNSVPTSRNSLRQDSNYIPTPFRTTTGESAPEKRNDVPCHIKAQPTVGIFRQSTAPRKSIFDMAPSAKKDKLLSACAKTAANTPKDPKAPCFNPSLLGSPFYAGRTMYGGASTSTYINQPNIKQRKIAQVNESKNNDTVNMSYSARQVMDLLENFTSPLVEARRIPVISRNPNVSRSFTLDTSLPSTSTNNTNYKSQELYVPSIASILRLKQRSRLMDTTKAARQIIASHSSTLSNFQPYIVDTRRQESNDNIPSAPGKESEKSDITPKLKTRLTRKPRSRDAIDGSAQLPETVVLPTAVLQIDKNNLPKFSFGEIPQSSTATSAKTTYTQTSSELGTFNKASSVPEHTSNTSSMFKFSSPDKITDSHVGDGSPPTFTFGSPERRVDNKSNSSFRPAISTLSDNHKMESQSANTSDWSCPDCMVKNKSTADKCPCCGAKQPSKDVKQNKPLTNTNAMPLTGLKSSGNWSCSDCWASNPQANDKCLCCGGKNPTREVEQNVSKSESLLKDWKCEDCWISNKSSVDKCAACGGAKPGTKPTAPSLPVTSFTSKPLVNNEKDKKWRCQTCLVDNSTDKSSCVCCGVEKSGGDKEATKKLFNFSSNTNMSFKFGIDPKLQEAALKKSEEVTVNAYAKPAEESETNNNIVPKISSSFTMPTSNTILKSQDKEESKTPTFTFGIPKPTHTLTTESTFTVKQSEPELKTQKEEDEENPQEVPKIVFKAPEQEVTKPTGFFAPSLTAKLEEPAPTFGVFANSSLDKEKITLSNHLTSATLTKDEKPEGTFTFGSSGVKPAGPIFGAPASTASITSGTPLTAVSTSSTPSLSMFQKPETSTSTMSLFPSNDTSSSAPTPLFQQKIETTPTTPAPATSLFSFGSNTQSSTVAPSSSAPLDKPKFNFTFGNSNSTENQSSGLFKSPFPPTTENSENKFTLPNSNALGNNGNVLGGNSLGGNVLGGSALGGSGLGGSTLGGNGLGANTLGGNGLGANTLGGNALGTSALGGNALGGNTLGSNALGGNALGGNPLAGNALGGNTLGGNILGGNTLGGNTLGGNNTMSGNLLGSNNDNNMATAPIFGSSMQKTESTWPNNNAPSNIFASNTTNSMTKPAPFTFGAPTPFNASNTPSNPPVQNIFGANAQPTQNVFGIGNQSNASQPSLFQSQPQSQPAPMFGTSTPTPNLFVTPSAPAPAFGATNQTMSSGFDNTSMTPAAPAPAFNFGQQQQAPAVFGFGQSTPQNAGVYNFGGAPTGGQPQQLQFSMGSAPNTNLNQVRRMRKAVRRNPR